MFLWGMETLPFYISGGFIATTLLTLFLCTAPAITTRGTCFFDSLVDIAGRLNPERLLPGARRRAAPGLIATQRGRSFLDSFDADN